MPVRKPQKPYKQPQTFTLNVRFGVIDTLRIIFRSKVLCNLTIWYPPNVSDDPAVTGNVQLQKVSGRISNFVLRKQPPQLVEQNSGG